jgi:hypothetical protein
MFNNFFFENRTVYQKYCTAGHATYNMGHAYCMLDTKCYKHNLRICYRKQNIHSCSINCVSNIVPFMEKYCTVGQTTHKMGHAYCMLDTKGYKHTLRICTTYCISTATLVAQKRLNVTADVHCLALSCCHTLWNVPLTPQSCKNMMYGSMS